jgi:hypothetical protein
VKNLLRKIFRTTADYIHTIQDRITEPNLKPKYAADFIWEQDEEFRKHLFSLVVKEYEILEGKTNLEILKYGLKFTQWGQLYIGLKFGLTTVKELMICCSLSLVTPCTEDRLVKLYMAESKGYGEFYKTLRIFMKEDDEYEIPDLTDRVIYIKEDNIPESFYEIWKLALLLKVPQRIGGDGWDKMDAISCVCEDFDPQGELREFTPYFGAGSLGEIRVEERYKIFLQYLDRKLLEAIESGK